jgi:hypothetical protein
MIAFASASSSFAFSTNLLAASICSAAFSYSRATLFSASAIFSAADFSILANFFCS